MIRRRLARYVWNKKMGNHEYNVHYVISGITSLATNNSFFPCFNKIYCYIVILFLCYVFPQSILCWMDKCNLFLSTNVLLFSVSTILIHHSMHFFSALSQKKLFYLKIKNNTQSSCIIFFPYFIWDGHIF